MGGRKLQGKRGNPSQVFQQHHRAHHCRHPRGEEIRRRAAEVHPRDDHVEEEVDKEGVAGEIGEVQQQRQGQQVEDDLEKDLAVNVPLARSVLPAEAEQQVIAQHGASDHVERRRPGDDPQRGAGQPDHGEDRRAGQPAQRDQPAGAFGGKLHGAGARGWGLGASASCTMFVPQGRLLAGGFASDADRQKLSVSCTGRWGLGRITTLLHGVPGDGGGAFLEVEGEEDVIVDPRRGGGERRPGPRRGRPWWPGRRWLRRRGPAA